MLKKIVYAVLCFLPSIGLAQQTGFTIKGKIGRWSAPVRVYLKYSKDNKLITDSVLLKDGKFEIRGNISKTTMASLILSKRPGLHWPYDELFLYITPGITAIHSQDSVANADVSGNEINTAYSRYRLAFKVVTTEKEAENYAMGIYRQLIKENLSSFVILSALNAGNYITDYIRMDSLLHEMPVGVQQSKEGLELSEKISRQQNIAIGSLAPDFEQPDTSGNPVKLSALHGKYVLLDFWASWCKPCRAENPALVKIYDQFKNNNFTILGVSIDALNGKAKWLQAIRTDGLQWIQVSDLKRRNEAAVLYDIQSVPSNFLIDPHGHIIAKDLHGEALEKKLAELFD